MPISRLAWPKASNTASSKSGRRGPTSATSSSGGRWSPTSCRASVTATISRSPPGSSPIRPPRPGTGTRPTQPTKSTRRPSRRRVERRRSTPRAMPSPRSNSPSPRSGPAARRVRPSADESDADDARSDSAPLLIRAAEASFAIGRPARATAYLETVMSALDERRDRTALGLLHERLGRYRRAAGDSDGAVAALERAVALVPAERSAERATVLAALAQVKMLEGTFSDAERLAREAIRVAESCGPEARAQLAHATTTLGVSLGLGRRSGGGGCPARRGTGAWRRRPATTTSCSGCTPTSRRSSISSAGARRR